MKALILSDIHGSTSATAKALNYFESFHCDYLFLLGDLLYHGPRNTNPLGHDTMEVAELLNDFDEKIIAVRGNCDTEMDQTLLSFSCMTDYIPVFDTPHRLFLTHGHLYDPSLIQKTQTDAFISGHTHRPILELNVNGVLCCNPGSISLPRGEFAPTFGFYNQGEFSLHLLEQGKEISKLALPTK